ncbi:hypothetical protein C2S52_008820 [Perilla frutescens var. hirtella]|nr:hypothetical protein C2S52_008820 [Perilla frutescens var. hirtella]
MIYKKWSLLTGHISLIVGVIDTIMVADLQFAENSSGKNEGKNILFERSSRIKNEKTTPMIFGKGESIAS